MCICGCSIFATGAWRSVLKFILLLFWIQLRLESCRTTTSCPTGWLLLQWLPVHEMSYRYIYYISAAASSQQCSLMLSLGCSTQMSFTNGTNSEEIKNASILLIRKLYVLMQNLGPLPNDITLTMKLFYYNDGRWWEMSSHLILRM